MTRTFGGGNPNPFNSYLDDKGEKVFTETFEEHQNYSDRCTIPNYMMNYTT
jgi:hypothetical protein